MNGGWRGCDFGCLGRVRGFGRGVFDRRFWEGSGGGGGCWGVLRACGLGCELLPGVSGELCKRPSGCSATVFLFVGAEWPAQPAGAARRDSHPGRTAHRLQGRALGRGAANPCCRAPFCDLTCSRRAASRAERSACWWALSVLLARRPGLANPLPADRVQVVQHLLPVLHRLPLRDHPA